MDTQVSTLVMWREKAGEWVGVRDVQACVRACSVRARVCGGVRDTGPHMDINGRTSGCVRACVRQTQSHVCVEMHEFHLSQFSCVQGEVLVCVRMQSCRMEKIKNCAKTSNSNI